mmetsp:Transcript_21929/g.39752  ORF Transcript_21929/g.39752 Transcript_21929/m.39752 type:complete len:335 (-) Transcript_21929:43-1047(-)
MERSHSAPARRKPSPELEPLNQSSSSLSLHSSISPHSSQLKAQKNIDHLLDSGKFPSSWNSRDVGDWIEVIGFPQYRRMFISRAADGNILLSITPAILDQIGVRNLGHQSRILNKVAELKEAAFRTQGSIDDVAERKHVMAFVKRQRDLERRESHLKTMQQVLVDLTKKGVFGILQESVQALGMDGGKDLVTSADDSLSQLKTKIAECEKTLSEERAVLFSDVTKTASDLGCPTADLLTGDLFVPSHKPMLNTDEVKKMYVKVQGRNWETLIPDQLALKQKQRKREEADVIEWKKKASPNTFGLPNEERRNRIDAFWERTSQDVEERRQRMGKM